MSKRSNEDAIDYTEDFNDIMAYISDSTVHPALRYNYLIHRLPTYRRIRASMSLKDSLYLVWFNRVNRLENYEDALKFVIELDALHCPL